MPIQLKIQLASDFHRDLLPPTVVWRHGSVHMAFGGVNWVKGQAENPQWDAGITVDREVDPDPISDIGSDSCFVKGVQA